MVTVSVLSTAKSDLGTYLWDAVPPDAVSDHRVSLSLDHDATNLSPHNTFALPSTVPVSTNGGRYLTPCISYPEPITQLPDQSHINYTPIKTQHTVVDAQFHPLSSSFTPYHPHISVPLSSVNPESTLDSTNSHRVTQDHAPLGVERHTRRPIITTTRRKTRAVGFEPDVMRLQDRLRRHMVPEALVNLIGIIFSGGVNLNALLRQQTDAEVENGTFGCVAGRVYLALLEPTPKEGVMKPRHMCRLCPGGHLRFAWKHERDVLRHLRRDHFGLAEICAKWYACSTFINPELVADIG